MNAIDISISDGGTYLCTSSVEEHPLASEHRVLLESLSQVADSLIHSIDIASNSESESFTQSNCGNFSQQLKSDAATNSYATPALRGAIKRQLQEHQWPQATCTLLQNINLQRLSGVGIAVAVEVVGSRRITELNRTFRDKNSSTNVLSFPAHGAGDSNGNSLSLIHI